MGVKKGGKIGDILCASISRDLPLQVRGHSGRPAAQEGVEDTRTGKAIVKLWRRLRQVASRIGQGCNHLSARRKASADGKGDHFSRSC